MILEGFEIENWTCIQKLSITGLPPTGVIVLHGPNRRGKSSIVKALRACLMDYPSTTAAADVKSCFPRGSGEKPVVTVTFQADGACYRIKKHFGSTKSELASRTPTGAWKVETTSAAEAHERTCMLVGGDDSSKGLHQLLWLTQAEFHLPKPAKFDPSVQAQLRGILGVLQTPLDDCFIERVRQRWNTWYSGQRKGKTPSMKGSCPLSGKLSELERMRTELDVSNAKFVAVEGLLRNASALELAKADLTWQLEERTRELLERQDEQRKSRARILARQQAENEHFTAQKERDDALDEQRQRVDAVNRYEDAQKAVEPARSRVDLAQQNLVAIEQAQGQRRSDIQAHRDLRRELQRQADRVAARLRKLVDTNALNQVQEELRRAELVENEIADIERYLNNNPVPEPAVLKALRDNRQWLAQLLAARDAASMSLKLMREAGAAETQLALDGEPPRQVPASADPECHAVRRKAELHITGWGRIDFGRGLGQGDLEQIEVDLRRCHDEFLEGMAPFGIAATNADALDQILQRQAECQLKRADLKKRKTEFRTLAPKDLGPLRARVTELQAKLQQATGDPPSAPESNSDGPDELDEAATKLKAQLAEVDADIEGLQTKVDAAESSLEQARGALISAKEELATCNATAGSRGEELHRLRTDEEIAKRIADATDRLQDAKTHLAETELTPQELTIEERLAAAQEAVGALQNQLQDVTSKYDVIKGQLLESEGLHSRRSSLAARVDELTRTAQRELLERDAVDRLYALFEDCRQKQLGSLMGPIHDRVLRWMSVLEIGDYREMRFNDAFLPDRLLSRDGTAEFDVDEESTGAQEQIGMLVRLALGSVLASASQPAVAVLDDPLTHCDVGRLNKMRVILRRIAEGDVTMTPPAGPLQIIVLTCHPEWFRGERATVIDLEDPAILSRISV